MAKNDNAHAVRLAKSLTVHGFGDAAELIAAAHPLSKSADAAKKFAWAQAVCRELEVRFPAETIELIRRDCRCNDGKAIADKMRRYLSRAACLADFVRDFNAHETFASLTYLAERKLLLCYPTCYCACVKRGGEQLSRTWCACTLGNAQRIFEQLLDGPVQTRLRKSIMTGVRSK